MAMTKDQKSEMITDLTERLKESDHFYITDTSGLTVAEVNKFREMCFKSGIQYKILKNTLIKKALENLDTDYSSFDSVLVGTSGVMFVKEDAKLPAKVIKDFKKDDPEERPKFKAASIDSDLFIGEDKLDLLSKLKSKQELVGEIITLLQSPAKNVISALQSAENKLAGIVKTLSEKTED